MPLTKRENYNEYMRQFMKKRWTKRRNLAISLMGGKCVHCGSEDKLEFDHVDAARKSFNVSRASSWSNARFWPEMQKCQLLCRTCHRVKSNFEQSVPHGGGKSGKKNCPCEPCKALRRAYMREYMGNRRTNGVVV